MEPVGMDKEYAEEDRETHELMEEGILTETGELNRLNPLIYFDPDKDEDHLQQLRRGNDSIAEELDEKFDRLVEPSAHGRVEGLGLNFQAFVAQAKPEEEDVEILSEIMNMRHLNVVIVGHMDAVGKTAIGGQILLLSGVFDPFDIHQYKKEAEDNGRESWYLAYMMDPKKVVKGVGRAHFKTQTKRFTIFDTPDDENYIAHMISGASQADVGVLVISARMEEFEAGYEKSLQNPERVQLAKVLGVRKLFVVVDNMDDPSVMWSEKRYKEIVSKMKPVLRQSGYYVKEEVDFLPVSGLHGTNINSRVDKSICPWSDSPCLFEALDTVPVFLRDPEGPFRMPILHAAEHIVLGKVESGTIHKGDILMVMPPEAEVQVLAVVIDEDHCLNSAGPGENIRIVLSDEEDISSGFVLSSFEYKIPVVLEFDARLVILLDNDNFAVRRNYVLHIHCSAEVCEIDEILRQIDPKTKKPMEKKDFMVKYGAILDCRIKVDQFICIEKASDFRQLGSFTLRTTDGKLVAVGQVTNL